MTNETIGVIIYLVLGAAWAAAASWHTELHEQVGRSPLTKILAMLQLTIAALKSILVWPFELAEDFIVYLYNRAIDIEEE
jgi:hypothetical protein